MKQYILITLAFIFLFASTFAFRGESIYAETEVTHIFTHCLIAYPEIAFNKNNRMAKSYAHDCITSNEFKSLLQELYNKNFVLVDIHKTYNVIDNTAKKTVIKVPTGKKPLILSFDDVNYDHKKMGLGMVDKLIIHKGKVKSLTKFSDSEDISQTREFVPILESFIEKHPDFSYGGAKGVINLTGYDGVFGYRTQRTSQAKTTEILEAKKIANLLKKNGWSFACHTYGHYHMKNITTQKFQDELNKWNDEVVPIIGKTNLYVYPYGEFEVLTENNTYSKKHELLLQNGFNLFLGVGLNPFFSYLPKTSKMAIPTLFMDRIVVDGFTLQNRAEQLSRTFNPEKILNRKERNLN